MRLGRRYGAERLEAASRRAEQLRSASYRTVKNILSSAQDRLPFDEPQARSVSPTPVHANIRGASYYAALEEEIEPRGTSCSRRSSTCACGSRPSPSGVFLAVVVRWLPISVNVRVLAGVVLPLLAAVSVMVGISALLSCLAGRGSRIPDHELVHRTQRIARTLRLSSRSS